MSGFGIRALKKVKEEENKDKQTYIRHIVFGENSYAVLMFLKLNQKYPGEVKIITKNPFYKEELLKEWSCSLNSVRSQVVADKLLSLNPALELFRSHDEVNFYKDTKFQKFGGRAKPHELKEGESFFTKAPFNIKLEALFGEGQLDNLEQILKDNQLNRILREIEVCSSSTDLVEVTNFRLQTGEFESFNCEKLYFCESPKTFYSLVKNKNTIPDNVQAYIAPIINQQGICVNYKSDKEIFDKEGTLFLPQSVTHEWGSFILDFKAFDPEKKEQEFTALTFIGEEAVQEDDLAKKIKLMNRVIERVLPEYSKANIEQSIKYHSEYRITGYKDELFDSLKDENIQFFGHAAPLNIDHSEEFEYLARAITSIMLFDIK